MRKDYLNRHVGSYRKDYAYQSAFFDVAYKKVNNEMFRLHALQQLTHFGYREDDLSNLTVYDIIDKIRQFIESKPSNVDYIIFLEYLANYPVSLCRRKVSPLLRLLIGMQYRLGDPNNGMVAKSLNKDLLKKVSYSDLSKIFVRSKATISEAVKETEEVWQEWENAKREHEQVEKVKVGFKEDARIRGIALTELLEEEKANLKQDIVVSQ